jgi:vacuolar-type H+-ATPase subunit H
MTQLCLPLFSKLEFKRIRNRIKGHRYKLKHRERLKARERLRRNNNLEHYREYQREWYKNNPERMKNKRKRLRQKNPEHAKDYQRQWRLKNPDKCREYQKRYTQNHRGVINKTRKQWYSKNQEHWKELRTRYEKSHHDVVKAGKQRYVKNRRRYLGYVALNQYVEGLEGHHVDKVHVVYIPKSMHESIYHNVWNGHGMKAINAKVFEWLSQQSKTVPLLEIMSVATS